MALTADGFEKLLSLLASDREAAGEQYELVRLKLAKYFDLRMCPSPEDLVDETIDRVARRLAEGEQIQALEPMRYVYGVARNVFLESRKTEWRHAVALDGEPADDASRDEVERTKAELQLDCFHWCLEKQSEESRSLLFRYYEHTGRTKTDRRMELARQMAIPVNALRIRIHRMKGVIQRCMEKCVGDRKVNDE